MRVKDVFLLGYPLVVSLLKPKEIQVFWNQKKKKSGPNGENPFNSSIDKFKLKNYIKLKIKKSLIARAERV